MTTPTDYLTQILTIAADCDDDVTAELAQKALDGLSVDLGREKIAKVLNDKAVSIPYCTRNHTPFIFYLELADAAIDHLFPLITRAPNENALAAFDDAYLEDVTDIACYGDQEESVTWKVYNFTSEQEEKIRKALGAK